ncbi:hypothetical protein BGZ94_007067 [Podila epigama]|nr:hypothetical protein BGZ94_007067 [Podila epigama]
MFMVLPTECIDLILHCVSDDRPSLFALLTVSRASFNAAILHLFRTCVVPQRHHYGHLKLATLTFASALTHHQPRPATSIASANDILAPFGLSLPTSLVPGSLLEMFLASGKRTTIDYSRLFDTLEPMRTNDFLWHAASDLVPKILDPSPECEPSPWTREDNDQKAPVRDNIRVNLFRFLLDHIAEHVTKLTFDICHAHEYHGLVHRMKRLQTLVVEHSELISPRNAQDAVHFVEAIRTAFPHTDLDLEFNWTTMGFYFPSASDMSLRIEQCHRTQILLYKALKHPIRLYRSTSPLFYSDFTGVEFDRLRIFSDDDGVLHITPADEEARQRILQNAPALTDVSVLVLNPGVFEWVKNDARLLSSLSKDQEGYVQQQQQQKQMPFQSLRRLKLISYDDYLQLLKPVQDLSGLLLPKLQKLELIQTRLRYGLSSPPPSNEQVFIGDFAFAHLRELCIKTRNHTDVRIGTFHACPNLESLTLDMSLYVYRHSSNVPAVRHLAPKWHLPALKYLYLHSLGALPFDYDSLESMPNLEILHIVSRTDPNCPPVSNVPRLSKHWAMYGQEELRNQTNTLTMNSTDPLHDHDHQQLWSHSNWNLPKLKILKLFGFPALVFTMGWLEVCPSLEDVTVFYCDTHYQKLRLQGPTQESPLPDMSILSLAEQNDNNTTSRRSNGPPRPNYASKVKSLNLTGKWIIEYADLTYLLKYLVPNLRTLIVDRTTNDFGISSKKRLQNGKEFLKAIIAADIPPERYHVDNDDIGNSNNSCITPPPSRRLTSVTSKFYIGKGSAESQFGLVSFPKGFLPLYQALGKRIYSMDGDLRIHKSDRLRTDRV